MARSAEHWTDEEILGYLYGADPEDGHVAGCSSCQARVEAFRKGRVELEEQYRPDDDVSFEFLAAQRRRIYARMESSRGGFGVWRRWASAAAALVIIGGGVAVMEQRHIVDLGQEKTKVSDAELAAEVSDFAASSEPQPAAPLRALFEE